MKGYSYYGVTDFVLCLGYKSNVIKEYFLNYNAMMTDFTVSLGRRSTVEIHEMSAIEEDWKVTLADTGEDTMTGGRVHRASPYFSSDETFLVTYGDGVADINISQLVSFHMSHGKLATLTGVRPPSKFGELQYSGNRVQSFSEKPTGGQGLVNGGFFCFKEIFCDTSVVIVTVCLNANRLRNVPVMDNCVFMSMKGFGSVWIHFVIGHFLILFGSLEMHHGKSGMIRMIILLNLSIVS